MRQNVSFGGPNPLAPVKNVPTSVVKAQSIFFASLAITFLVAFIAVLWKQWILYYTRATTQGSVADQGKERHIKFAGLQKWGLHAIMKLLPVLLQSSLLLFAIGLLIYLWDIDASAEGVILATTFVGSTFYACIAVAATIWDDCPYQTPLSILFLKILSWLREIAAGVRARPRQWSAVLLPWIKFERAEEHDHLMVPVAVNQFLGNAHDGDYMRLSNPAFWRQDPLFPSPVPMDIATSAAIWLIENSTDFSTLSAVAAVFFEFQWPSNHRFVSTLIRLRDAYRGYSRAPKSDNLARIQALQCGAAYYFFYHARFIRNIAEGCDFGVEKLPSDLPPDLLLLHKDTDEWQGLDLFEYLLYTVGHSRSVKWAQFLSYIAPYWFCGDADSAIRYRSYRLPSLGELIAVLESSKALGPGTLTDCMLCVGAAMDFPLHPEDLIRVDKRCVLLLGTSRVVLISDSKYFVPTIKAVVEHILDISLTRSRRYRHVVEALEILLTLARHPSLPRVDAAWINDLLKRAAVGEMVDKEFILLLKLSAWRKEEGVMVDTGVGYYPIQHFEIDPQALGTTATSEAPTPDGTLFSKVMKTIQEYGWQEEAVYGGILAIRDIRRLGPSLFDDDALQTFHEALNRGNSLRIRQAAYDAMLVTRDQWLMSPQLRKRIEEFGLFRQLHRVVIEIARSDYQQSFLMMMGILSEDPYWRSYLREDMDIWFPLRREGSAYTAHIVANVGELSLARRDSYILPTTDDLLRTLIVAEWAAVPGPGRQVHDLTADRLKPLAEVTERFKELLFDDRCRREVIATVERVLPALALRRDDGYTGPEDDVRDIINDLLAKLRIPPRRRLTFE